MGEDSLRDGDQRRRNGTAFGKKDIIRPRRRAGVHRFEPQPGFLTRGPDITGRTKHGRASAEEEERDLLAKSEHVVERRAVERVQGRHRPLPYSRRQTEDRALVAHATEAEATVAVSLDRDLPWKMRTR